MVVLYMYQTCVMYYANLFDTTYMLNIKMQVIRILFILTYNLLFWELKRRLF